MESRDGNSTSLEQLGGLVYLFSEYTKKSITNSKTWKILWPALSTHFKPILRVSGFRPDPTHSGLLSALSHKNRKKTCVLLCDFNPGTQGSEAGMSL